MSPYAESDFIPTAQDAEKAMILPLGFSSPLWFAFTGVATAGVAYWWMTQWARPVNIEAGQMVPVVEAAAEDVVEALVADELVLEEAVEEATEAVMDAAEDVTETLMEAAEPILEPAPAVADDLTRLVGIGPRLAVSLAERGVTRFSQIADWGADELAFFDRELSLKGRAVRDAWVAQAKRFAEA